MKYYQYIEPKVKDNNFNLLSEALSTIQARHDNLAKIKDEDKLKIAELEQGYATAINSMGFNENESEYMAELHRGLEEVADTGDVASTIEYMTDVIRNPRTINRIESQKNYEEFIKTIDSSSLSEDKKRWKKETNPYEYNETFNEETDTYSGIIWKPRNDKYVEEIDPQALKEYAIKETSRELGNYGKIFYKTEDGNYTDNTALASELTPYYRDSDGSFVEIPVEEVKDKLRNNILSNSAISNSLIQEYEYGLWKQSKGEWKGIPNSENPVTDSRGKILSKEQYIDKVINGYLDYSTPYIYYSNEYVNPAVGNSKNPKNGNPLILNSDGDILNLEGGEETKIDVKRDDYRINRLSTDKGKSIKYEDGKGLTDSWVSEPESIRANIVSICRSNGIDDPDLNNLQGEDLVNIILKHYNSENSNLGTLPIELFKQLMNYIDANKQKEILVETQGDNYYKVQAKNAILNGTDVDADNPYKYYVDHYVDYKDIVSKLLKPSLDLRTPLAPNVTPTQLLTNQSLEELPEYAKFNYGELLKSSLETEDTELIPQEVIDLNTAAALMTGYWNNTYRMQGEDKDVETKKDNIYNNIVNLTEHVSDIHMGIGINSEPISYGKTNIGNKSTNITGTMISDICSYISALAADNKIRYKLNITFDVNTGNSNIKITVPDKKSTSDENSELLNKFCEALNVKKGDTVSIRIDDLISTKELNNFLNSPEITARRKINRIKYSNLPNYSLRTVGDERILHYQDGSPKINDFNIKDEQVVDLMLAQDRLTEFDYKFTYGIDENYELTKEDITSLFDVFISLYPDIVENMGLSDKVKQERIKNNCYQYLKNINEDLAIQFNELVTINE